MRRSLFALACLVAAAAVFGPAVGALAQQQQQQPLFNLSDDIIRQIMQVARDHLHEAKLPDGSTVAPESPAEKSQELIPFATGRRVVEAGFVSGVAVKCGVDWKQSKMPQAVSAEKAKLSANPRASAYIEFLQGVAMANVEQQVKECNPTLKQRVTQELAERWK